MTIKVSRNRIDFGTTGLKNYAETVNALGSVSGSVTIDFSLGQVVTATAAGAVTWSITNPPASGVAGSLTLILTNGGTATQTWPSGTKWPIGTAPVLDGAVDIITFMTVNAGTTWRASAGMLGSPLKLTVPTYGYFAGGVSITFPVATADRITFSTGVTIANTVSKLSTIKYALAGLSSGSDYGYFAGGVSSGTTKLSTADRIAFSTGATAANTASNLSQARQNLIGLSDKITYGYFAGGDSGSVVTTADRITFSTGATVANTASKLSQARSGLAGLSDAVTYGYFAGGDSTGNPDLVVTADRITFSTGATVANTASNLSQARNGPVGLSSNSTYGYFAGGDSSGSFNLVTTTDCVTFSTGATAANTVSNLSLARMYLASSSDGATYGYFAGGYAGSATVTADRITFSTGTTVANTVSNLSQARYYLAGLSDLAV